MEINQVTHDKSFTIKTYGEEWRMSHWVYSPEISDNNGIIVFSLKGSDCDLRKFSYNNGCWLLKLFKYPNGLHGINVALDFPQGIGYIDDVKFNKIIELQNELIKPK